MTTREEMCINRLAMAIGKASAAFDALERDIAAVESGRPVFTLRELAAYAARHHRELEEAWAARDEVRHAS